MPGRTWRAAGPEALARVRSLLLRRGGIEDERLGSPHEVWRIRIDRTVFTGYTSGTIYCNGATLPELVFLYDSISDTLERSRRG